MMLKLYLITLFVYSGMGWLWFILIGHRFQRLQFGNLLPGNLNFILAGVLYLIAVAGFFYLVIEPFLRQGSVTSAAIASAIVGMISSAADSWAGLSRGWPIWFVLTYIAWSTIMTATTAAITVWVWKRMHG